MKNIRKVFQGYIFCKILWPGGGKKMVLGGKNENLGSEEGIMERKKRK